MAGNPVRGEWFTILQAGEYPGKFPITMQDVEDMANDYDINFRRGTVGIGHPGMLDNRGRLPNLATVGELRVQGDELKGRLINVSRELVDGYESDRYPSWSGRIIPPFLSETGRMYLEGLDFLGIAQPAIAGMRVSFNAESALSSFSAAPVDKEGNVINQPLEEVSMPENQVTLTLDQVKTELTQFQARVVDPLSTQLSKLNGLPDLVRQLTEKVDQLSKNPVISAAELEQLKNSANQTTELQKANDRLLDSEAEREVAAACAGIPAAVCPEEKRTLMKKWYKEDRASFDLQKKEYAQLRPMYKDHSTELVGEGDGSAESITNKEGALTGPDVDDLANRRSVRAFEIVKAKGFERGKPGFADQLALAQQEACEEIKK